MAIEDLQDNPMMSHLLESLNAGKDIGHYGRLVFVMVGRHFMSEQELSERLCAGKGCSHEEAVGLIDQVQSRGYSPPSRNRILDWQSQQDFPICPEEGPDGCNVYRNLRFPDGVYDKINKYHVQRAEAHEHHDGSR